jgi:enoyl-CoA hydratase
MTTTPCFTLQTADHVAHLVLSRPGVMNTMNPQFWRELDELLVTLHKDNSARALVISSTGKHFSAGMALETFGGGIQMDDQNPEGRAAIFRPAHRHAGHLHQNGDACASRSSPPSRVAASAARWTWSHACCVRYATADAFFCIQEINIGMVADVGTLQRLPKLIPEPIAWSRNWPTPAGACLPPRPWAYGLVNEVFDTPEAMRGRRLAVRAKSPAKPPVPSGAPSRPSTTHATTPPKTPAADGLAAGRHLEQPACARSGHGNEAKTRRGLPCTALKQNLQQHL